MVEINDSNVYADTLAFHLLTDSDLLSINLSQAMVIVPDEVMGVDCQPRHDYTAEKVKKYG